MSKDKKLTPEQVAEIKAKEKIKTKAATSGKIILK